MVWRIKPQDALPLGVIQGFETTLRWFFKKRVKLARRACPASAGNLNLLPQSIDFPDSAHNGVAHKAAGRLAFGRDPGL
jgi:hypothetical protein